MIAFVIAAVVILFIIIIVIIASSNSNSLGHPHQPWIFEAPERRVGRIGEQRATNIIRSVLKDDDRLFTNVQIKYEDKPAELDNVVINKFGVFIIEVKNYNGRLVGSEDDYEWLKYHTTDAGNTYSKTVKNPIKQVKRQIYVLAKYLEYYSVISVWVEGYSILLHENSPVESKYVLSNVQDIGRVIHTSYRNRLSLKDIEDISRLLS